VNPATFEELKCLRMPIKRLGSKEWEALVTRNAATLNFVVTLRDQALGERALDGRASHPAHRGTPSPPAVEGGDAAKGKAFQTSRWRAKPQLPLARGYLRSTLCPSAQVDVGHSGWRSATRDAWTKQGPTSWPCTCRNERGLSGPTPGCQWHTRSDHPCATLLLGTFAGLSGVRAVRVRNGL
jgi:hypothetical protein